MNPFDINHNLAGLRLLLDFARGFQLITRQDAQEDQIEAVKRVKGGELNEAHAGEQREAEGT